MTRLDENRAKAQLAQKARAQVGEVSRVAIWGNHSTTQFPNFEHARIRGQSAESTIADRAWLEGDFMTTVQDRGATIIKARGKSSAASAANAALDTIRSLINPTPADDWFSAAIPSEGNPYGVAQGLIYSFPLRRNGDGTVSIVEGLEVSEYALAKIKASETELLMEREAIKHLL
jgi:malate dehydrogenase